MAVAGCGDAPEASGVGIESAWLIEVRLVREEGGADLVTVEFDGDTTYLDPEPLLSDEDLTRVEPLVRPGQLILQLELTAGAMERMASRTAAEVGNRLAIIVDGEMRSAPIIRDAVRGPGILTISASEEEATRLAELVRSKWPHDAR